MNVLEGDPVERQMTTGNHIVRDIQCVKCYAVLGWKYVSVVPDLSFPDMPSSSGVQEYAYEEDQKYKEGKFILERNLLVEVQ